VHNGKNLTAVKTLIALGADVNATPTVSPMALTPLMLLAQEGDFWDMAETLMNAGANIHAVDAEGHTALVYAVKRNAKMVVKLLIEKGADPNVRLRRDNAEGAGYSDSSLLRLAADRRYTTIAAALLKAGADPNATEAYNFTALHQAVYDDNARLVALLLDYGADPRAVEAETNRDPLYYAKSDAVRQLLKGAVVA
jgi:ankyrin repeat protein